MNLFLFVTDPPFWRRPDVTNAVHQAQDAARRIAKAVNVGSERRRLSAALQTIDRAVRTAYPSPRVLGEVEAQVALRALPKIGGTRLPFCVGDQDRGGGFLLAPIPFQAESTFDPPIPPSPGPAPRNRDHVAAAVPDGGPRHGRERLIRAIAEARVHGHPISLGRARHSEIARAMRTYLHSDALPPFAQSFVYSDGSLSGPASLAQLPLRSRPRPNIELSIGFNSCRHFELDPIVDFYLLRTAEFDRQESASFGDQERFAYGRAQRLFQRFADKALHLRLYHTGLEPAAIGIYRAVIDRLLAGQSLLVTPVHYPGNPDEEAWW